MLDCISQQYSRAQNATWYIEATSKFIAEQKCAAAAKAKAKGKCGKSNATAKHAKHTAATEALLPPLPGNDDDDDEEAAPLVAIEPAAKKQKLMSVEDTACS